MLYILFIFNLCLAVRHSAVPAITIVSPQVPANVLPAVGSNGAVSFNGQSSQAVAGASEVPATSVTMTTAMPFVTSNIQLSYTAPTFTGGLGGINTRLDYTSQLNGLTWLPILQGYDSSRR